MAIKKTVMAKKNTEALELSVFPELNNNVSLKNRATVAPAFYLNTISNIAAKRLKSKDAQLLQLNRIFGSEFPANRCLVSIPQFPTRQTDKNILQIGGAM